MENILKPFYIRDVNEHTMGNSLYRYIDIKLHHLVTSCSYKNILVVGEYDRLASISIKEKTDKLVNWQRPSAEKRGDTLIIKCFPGVDYVKHYAALIATHLALEGKNPEIVSYILPKPESCIKALIKAGLNNIFTPKLIILGKVEDCLEIVASSYWSQNDGYIWCSSKNRYFALLGCKFSFWGDIGYHLISILASRGCEAFIFLGKLGSLSPNLIPNILLATGNESVLDGKRISWHNMLSNNINDEDSVIYGSHYTLSSVILETKDWLRNNDKYDFVDPEIGHMAKAANEKKCGFSYLHIISDNLAEKYNEDLSNERMFSVIKKRKAAQKKINNILSSFLAV